MTLEDEPPRLVQYTTGEKLRAITSGSRENEVAEPKWKWCSVVEMSGGKTKVWYDLNQNPYTVEVTNRFKGLDLVDRVPEELWMEVCNIVQEAVIKTIPKKKKFKKAKWLSEESL